MIVPGTFPAGVRGVDRGAFATVLAISGMRDNACRERVAEALARVDGAVDVSVSLIRARAIVVHGAACPPDALVRAVGDAGYHAALDPPGLDDGGAAGRRRDQRGGLPWHW